MADTPGKTGQKKKASTVRHTRAIQRDRSKRPTVTPPVGEIEARLSEVIHPATYAQIAAYHADGLGPFPAPIDQTTFDSMVTVLRAALTEPVLDAAYATGAALSIGRGGAVHRRSGTTIPAAALHPRAATRSDSAVMEVCGRRSPDTRPWCRRGDG